MNRFLAVSHFAARLFAGMVGATILAGSPVRAEPSGRDPRVVEQVYRADTIVDLVAAHGFEATIAFADGEHVENIAVGSSGTWQITPNRRADRVFVKPASPAAAATNMTIITDRRTYLFALHADRRRTPLYLLRFTYPDSPAPTPAAAAATPAEPAKPKMRPVDLSRINFGWDASGARAIVPDRTFDDGSAVYLFWAPGKPLPAILAAAPDGKSEGLVNYATDGDTIIVEGTPQRLILRSGRNVAYLARRPAPKPQQPGAAAPPLAAAVGGR